MHALYNIESIVLLFPDSLCEMVKVVEIGAVYSIVTCVMLFHTKLKKVLSSPSIFGWTS